jgi:carnitine-CoA ligase
VPAALGEHEVKLDVIGSVDLDELYQWLTVNLPRFMLPRYLEHRAGFPQTLSQRVEKYKLAAEPLNRPGVREFTPPPRRA